MELGTTDQDVAKKFYGGLFGWTFDDMPMGPDGVYTMFKLDGKVAAAGYTLMPEMRQMGIPPHWLVYIACADVDASAKRAGELGATVMKGPFDVFDAGRMAVVRDPGGAVFALWQAKRNTGVEVKGVNGAFCWADLITHDATKITDFYSQLLGWKFETSEHDSSGYLHLKNGNEFIGGVPPAKFLPPNVPPHWQLYFQAASCDATVEKAKAAGATVYFGPTSMEGVGRWAVVADPQGASFSVFETEHK